MGSNLYSFNITGILFVSNKNAEASAFTYHVDNEQCRYTEEIKLEPPIKGLSSWSDDRVIATFMSNIQPGELLDVIIVYTGGFYNKKKDLWPEVWKDQRIKDLVTRVVEKVIEKIGFSVETLQNDQIDWSGNY